MIVRAGRLRRATAGALDVTSRHAGTNEEKMCRSVIHGLTALLLVPSLSTAHHGIANFDHNKDVAITGVVTEISFINPHSWLYVDVSTDDGNTRQWRCELRAATVLRRSGWSEDMFTPGSEVRISGSPDRRQPTTCYVNSIVLEDGTRLDRYGQITAAEEPRSAQRPARLPNGRPNLSGDWAAEQGVMTDPRGKSGAFVPLSVARELEAGAVPEGGRAFPASRGTPESRAEGPLEGLALDTFPDPVAPTARGRAAAARFDTQALVDRILGCEPDNILFDLAFEGHVNRITQTEEVIRISYGFMDIERTIRLDLGEHPDDLEPSFAGHSLGRWEGDVLVVDTVGFTPGFIARTSNLMYSEELHVEERFTLDFETMTLTRTYIAEDPLYFVGEYRGTDRLQIADIPYQPYDCDDRTREP